MTAAAISSKNVFISTTFDPRLWQILIEISTYNPLRLDIKSRSVSIYSVKI